MTYSMYIGDYAYSSWSLRGWLLVRRFGLQTKMTLVPFAEQNVAEQIATLGLAPAKTVPTLITPEGIAVSESAAIVEELHERHPDAGLLPKDPVARSIARTLIAEMASGFGALRGDCPMALRVSYENSAPRDEVLADVARIETIWAHARTHKTSDGPWLLGEYCAADAFFAPVAARIAGYNLPVSEEAAAYVSAHLADPAFRRWRAMGLIHGPDLPWYRKDFPQRAWPGPKPLAAKAVDAGPSENESCPYSGKTPTYFMELDGRVFGMCNPFCRDKTVADPEAWPEFVALL